MPFFVIGSVMFLSLVLFTSVNIYVTVAAGVISAAIYLLLLIFARNVKHSIYIKVVFASVFIASMLFCGRYYCFKLPAQKLADSGTHSINAVVTDYTENSYGRYYCNMRITSLDGEESDVRARFSSYNYAELEPGDEIRMDKVSFYKTDRYGGSDIFVGCYSSETPSVTKRADGTFYSFAGGVRNYILKTVIAGMPQNSAAVVSALLTGDTGQLTDRDTLSFRYSGVSHLFAVSGLHLTIWTSILFFVLDSFVKRSRVFKAVVSSLFIVFFMFFTGFTRSVMRAGVMLLIYNMSRLISKRADSVNSLFMTLTLLLIYNPYLCTDVSLLMSFFSSLGLIVYSPRLSRVMGKYFYTMTSGGLRAVLLFVNGSICTSLAASLFTVVISGVFFGSFSIVSPITNLAAVPLAEVIMLLSACGALMSLIGAQGVFFIAADALAKLLLKITYTLSSFAECSVGMGNKACLVAAAAVFAAFLIVLIFDGGRRRKKRIAAQAGICAMVMIFICGCVSQYIAVRDDCVMLTCSGESVTVIFKYDSGRSILASSAPGGSGYTGISSAPGSRNTDVMILDDTHGVSPYLRSALAQSEPKTVIVPNGMSDSGITDRYENVRTTDSCTVRTGDNTVITYENNNETSYVYYKGEKTSCLVLLGGNVPDLNADLFIARGEVPTGLNAERFSKIVIAAPDSENSIDGADDKSVGKTEYLTDGGSFTYRSDH